MVHRFLLSLIVCLSMLVGSSIVVFPQQPQQDDDELRDITKDWRQKSPHKQLSSMGITVWRYKSDEKRDLVHSNPKGTKGEWTIERISGDPTLSNNENVRLTVESLRTGYLYIIDRAKYGDGSYGDATLIFPNNHIKEGDNKIMAGRPIHIPDTKDDPPYFTVNCTQSKSGAIQVSEELVFLITPQPIKALRPMGNGVKLSKEYVESLKQRYNAPVKRFEVQEENLSTKDPLQLPAADTPYPQTIYKVATKLTDPMLVVVGLNVQSSSNSEAKP